MGEDMEVMRAQVGMCGPCHNAEVGIGTPQSRSVGPQRTEKEVGKGMTRVNAKGIAKETEVGPVSATVQSGVMGEKPTIAMCTRQTIRQRRTRQLTVQRNGDERNWRMVRGCHRHRLSRPLQRATLGSQWIFERRGLRNSFPQSMNPCGAA